MPRKLLIAVPFYRGHNLVRPLVNSLASCAEEIAKLNGRIVFYNDSPDCIDLTEQLDAAQRILRNIPTHIHTNKKNIGFIKTCNQAFSLAANEGDDLLILNSDTVMFQGTLTELSSVAYEDPMIGFVSPRSNNATLATLPHGADRLHLSPNEAYIIFKKAAYRLERITYVPTAVGYCLYIKHGIIADFGEFDPTFGLGYNEENDLIMRANRFGYRAALANRAFVWHLGEASFKNLAIKRDTREATNAKILHERFPEFPLLINDYVHSPEYRAESLIISDRVEGKSIYIGFEFSDFGAFHNGTFEAGKKLLEAAARSWPQQVQIFVYIDETAWYFHQLDRLTGIIRRPPNSHEVVDAVVRMGQPFSKSAVKRLMTRASVIGLFMLDTIADDCGYLRVSLDAKIWHFVTKWSDVIFTNSKFTADQLARRFSFGHKIDLRISPHSLTPDEYLLSENIIVHSSLIGKTGKDYILVVGNKFDHKALHPTLEKLSSALSTMRFVALGCDSFDAPNVFCVASGNFSKDDIDALYSHASCVVFPTHYEGFGFPIMHALARKKPIFVRPLPPFQEAIAMLRVGSENVIWYKNTHELVRLLESGAPHWLGPAAAGEIDGWNRSASEVFVALQARIKNLQHKEIVDRLRWTEEFFNERPAESGKSNAGFRLLWSDLLSFPGYYLLKSLKLPLLIYRFGMSDVMKRALFVAVEVPANHKRQVKWRNILGKLIRNSPLRNINRSPKKRR